MKITEFHNEDAIDVLADLIEPAADIFSDENIIKMVRGGGNRMELAKQLLKNHKSSIIEILAIMNGFDDPADYKCNPITIIKDIVELLSDKELVDFFRSQAETMELASSILPAENTEADEQ